MTRHGKFLDVAAGDVQVIIHFARAGWIRWREGAPRPSGRPGKTPLAARLVLDGGQDQGSGLDVTEAGTKKSLAIYVVWSRRDVPG